MIFDRGFYNERCQVGLPLLPCLRSGFRIQAMSVLLDVTFLLMCSTTQSIPEDVGEAKISLAVECGRRQICNGPSRAGRFGVGIKDPGRSGGPVVEDA